MKLKLFSEEERTQEFVDDLAHFLALDNNDLESLLRTAVRRAKEGALSPRPEELERKFGREQVSTFMSLITAIAPRVLAGKKGAEVIDDLASFGLPKEKAQYFFSLLGSLSNSDKSALRRWALVREIQKNHLHGIEWDVEVRTLVDNGFVVGAVPFSRVKITIYDADKGEEVSWSMELSKEVIEDLLRILNITKTELDKVTAELKSNINSLLP